MEIRPEFLALVLACALVTAVPRVLPLVALSRLQLPRWLAGWLRYVPIAVLAALLAIELAPFNIQVNAVAPTFVFTPLTGPMFEDDGFREDVLSRIPLGRIAVPEEIVGSVVFLASAAADMITGHTLVVDGGWTAQ